MHILRVALLLIGLLGLLDTALVSTASSLNLGVLLPAILGAPLFLIGLFLPRLAPHLGGGPGLFLKRLFIIGYAAAFLAFTITWIVIDRKAAQYDMDEEADALIVLGAGLRGDTPTLVLRQRLDTAIAYLNAHPNAIAILSGGKGGGEHISEAEGMARYLAAAGIPQARYIREDQSVNTRENFAFSYAIIQERLGPDARIAFVTTDFHVFRAQLVARKQGMDVFGVAAPDVWYISLNNHLRESVALWAYALTGKI